MVDLCRPIWPTLAQRRLLITGGTGFFGTWLLETLAAANTALDLELTATIVSRDPTAFCTRFRHLGQQTAFTWVAGSAADFACPNTSHDFLLHLATATNAQPEQTDACLMLSTKLASIRHVIDVARRLGIQRALVTSSGAVYGPQPTDLDTIPESYGGAPNPMELSSAYGNGKRLVEQFCAATRELDFVIARCFSFVGPHLPLDARFAIGNFISDALSGGPIIVRGDGKAVRSYLYAGDLVVWLLTMLASGEGGTVYNVGSDEPVSIAALAYRVSAGFGNAEVRILGTADGAPIERYVPCIDRARRRFGLRVFTDLDAAIQRTIAWCRTATG